MASLHVQTISPCCVLQVGQLLDAPQCQGEFQFLPKEIKALVSLMLAPEPSDRPKAWQIVSALMAAWEAVNQEWLAGQVTYTV